MNRVLLAVAISSTAFAAECSSPSETQVQHGQYLYGRMCAVCHGQNGEGYVADQAPQISNPEYLAAASDDFLGSAIERGRPGTTMSAWGASRGGPLSLSDQQAMVAFMRTWQHLPPAVLDEHAPAGDAARGATLFSLSCAACHGAKGVGGRYEEVANPELLGSASNGFLRYSIDHGRPGTPMFGGLLSVGQIEDLVALLRSWQPPPSVDAGASPPPLLGPVVLNDTGPEPTGFLAYPSYTPADVVKAALDQGARFGIVDARAPTDYSAEHIAGAVSVPFYDPTPAEPELPKDAWLVCYCACPHAESSSLAQALEGAGFTKVAVIDEGFLVWKARGYPTRTGSVP